MKNTLVLMRHGEALDTQAGGSDYERPLSPKGDLMVRAQAQAMVEKNIWPDFVICSAAQRTRQTCDLLRQTWDGDMEPDIEHRTDLYQATPADIFKIMRARDPNHHTAMIIGHNPTIHQLAMMLCAPGQYSKYPKLGKGYAPGSIAVFEFNVRSWADIGEGKGKLIDFFSPKAA